MPFPLSRSLAGGVALFVLLAVQASGAMAQDMPPSSVGVIVIQPENLAVTAELPGRVSATRIADVRPRVGGIIENRVFEQGGLVKEGDVLFRLDRVTYEVAVESAKAAVARANAGLVEAEQNERRYASLNERNITSRADFETAVAGKLQAEAALAEARAQLRAAELNLGFTDVKAPISGRIGRAQVTEGALVGAQGEVLTTIQQLDPVYADIQQPVSELLRLRNALDTGELTQVEPGVAQVVLLLDDGTEYDVPGKLLFSEATVERSSGQVTLRAEFPNPSGKLLPGMYVRVSVEQATASDAIAVPAQAVQRDGRGAAQVYVVDAKSAVELRPVTLGRALGNRVIVQEGLKAGDMVVVDGFQKIGPGAPVSPVCWSDPVEGSEGEKNAEPCKTKLAAAPAAAPASATN
ncbi:efflux RND transporter periplasmic adaptor subunit [Paracoccus aminophilus]|uniref:RND multidrug efflux membrane permease n=1 Tax=Paracoccus aminophilus JCM 7686 TaxID=1367847 RepID=S5YGX0_PARAH|nr:efflux RND transporter periplasmic adaptor subunit [Paracoccus aminophilus]AGT10718.1 RND multidrug efflux membrane permease [Paracoccus aminophilus JCM 7686]